MQWQTIIDYAPHRYQVLWPVDKTIIGVFICSELHVRAMTNYNQLYTNSSCFAIIDVFSQLHWGFRLHNCFVLASMVCLTFNSSWLGWALCTCLHSFVLKRCIPSWENIFSHCCQICNWIKPWLLDKKGRDKQRHKKDQRVFGIDRLCHFQLVTLAYSNMQWNTGCFFAQKSVENGQFPSKKYWKSVHNRCASLIYTLW